MGGWNDDPALQIVITGLVSKCPQWLTSCTWKSGCQNHDYVQEELAVQYQFSSSSEVSFKALFVRQVDSKIAVNCIYKTTSDRISSFPWLIQYEYIVTIY